MNKVLYLSLPDNTKSLRQKLPLGPYWPEAWLSFFADRRPLTEKRSDFGILTWWRECPWSLSLAQDYEAALLRQKLLAKLAGQWQYVALSADLLWLGGGEQAWQSDLAAAGVTLVTGRGFLVLGTVKVLSQISEKPILIWLGEQRVPAGFLAWLCRHALFIILGCRPEQYAALELWQAQAAYETGSVIKCCQVFSPLLLSQSRALVLWDQPSDELKQAYVQNGSALPLWNIIPGLPQDFPAEDQRRPRRIVYHRSEPRRLLPVQGELLLCQNQPHLWKAMDAWQRQGDFCDIDQWLVDLAQAGYKFDIVE